MAAGSGHRPFKRASGFLGLFSPSTAPSRPGNLLAGKQRAATHCIGRFALIQRAVVALLASLVLREFLFVNFGRVGLVAERDRLRVGLGQRWPWRLCEGVPGQGNTAGCAEFDDELTTIVHGGLGRLKKLHRASALVSNQPELDVLWLKFAAGRRVTDESSWSLQKSRAAARVNSDRARTGKPVLRNSIRKARRPDLDFVQAKRRVVLCPTCAVARTATPCCLRI